MAKSKGSRSSKNSKGRGSKPQRGSSHKERPESGSSRNKAAVDGRTAKGLGRMTKGRSRPPISKKGARTADIKFPKSAKPLKGGSRRPSTKTSAKSVKHRKMVELEKHRRHRRKFLDYKPGISTADHRRAFCDDFDRHIKTVAHYRRKFAKETLEPLELKVFGAPLKDITDAAEKRLIDRIRQLQQAGVTTALTGTVEAPTKATISEATAYYRLRETLIILDKMMTWQYRILRWLRETHLGYAKHVIRELHRDFYRLEQTLAVFPLIWDPNVGTAHNIRSFKSTSPHSQRRKSGGASPRASNSSLYVTPGETDCRHGHRHDFTHGHGHCRHRSTYCENDPAYSRRYHQSDIHGCAKHKHRSTSGYDRHKSTIKPFEKERASKCKHHYFTCCCCRRVGGEDKPERQAPSRFQDPDTESMGHTLAKGKGEAHELSVVEQKRRSPHMDNEPFPDPAASTPEEEMLLIEGRIQYFQRAVSHMLDDVGRLIERLKDPAKVWHRDSQYMNAFSIKMQGLKQSLPEAYLQKPIKDLKNQLGHLIPLV